MMGRHNSGRWMEQGRETISLRTGKMDIDEPEARGITRLGRGWNSRAAGQPPGRWPFVFTSRAGTSTESPEAHQP